jgi:hypothetical protein
MNLLADSIGGLDKLFVDKLTERLTAEDRDKIAARLKKWLTEEARLKQLPDFDSRLVKMQSQLEKLAQTLRLELKGEEPVVKTDGEAAATLRKLEMGTDWFDPCNSVAALVISALWQSS